MVQNHKNISLSCCRLKIEWVKCSGCWRHTKGRAGDSRSSNHKGMYTNLVLMGFLGILIHSWIFYTVLHTIVKMRECIVICQLLLWNFHYELCRREISQVPEIEAMFVNTVEQNLNLYCPSRCVKVSWVPEVLVLFWLTLRTLTKVVKAPI